MINVYLKSKKSTWWRIQVEIHWTFFAPALDSVYQQKLSQKFTTFLKKTLPLNSCKLAKVKIYFFSSFLMWMFCKNCKEVFNLNYK